MGWIDSIYQRVEIANGCTAAHPRIAIVQGWIEMEDRSRTLPIHLSNMRRNQEAFEDETSMDCRESEGTSDTNPRATKQITIRESSVPCLVPTFFDFPSWFRVF